jgi:hypothetical protein
MRPPPSARREAPRPSPAVMSLSLGWDPCTSLRLALGAGRHGVFPLAARLAPAKPQRSPDKQASIERRRRLARQSPVPPELVDKFTQGEHAALTVVCGEIQRCGLCAWCLAKIAAIAGIGKTTQECDAQGARAWHAALEGAA